MSAPPIESESHGWARQRWLVIIGLVLASQLALIYWLAGHGTTPNPSRAAIQPRVYLPAISSATIPGASDPTIFVRPNSNGFSGAAWMQSPALPKDQPKWTDLSPPSNELHAQQLGGVLSQFLQSNSATSLEIAPRPEPEIPTVAPDDPLAGAQSTLTIEGGLANRALRQPLSLTDWPATDNVAILSNSVVQVGVNPNGFVFSAVPLNGSGSKDADAKALTMARTARFEPLQRHGGSQTDAQAWGQLVFHWHTVAKAATNEPAAK